MTFRKLFSTLSIFALVMGSLFISSCNKDEPAGSVVDPIEEPVDPVDPDPEPEPEPVETTVEEDKENIQMTFDDMLVCVDDMTSSRAIDVLMRDFLQISDSEVYNEDWIEDLSSKFNDVFDFDHIDENQRFNMVHHSGIYYYDHNTQIWVKNPSPTQIVSVYFPTSPDMTENNAAFIIDQYVDQAIIMDGEELYAPSQIHAKLNVDGERLFELNLAKVTYDQNATFEIPVEVEAILYMDPMEISLDVERLSSTEFTGMLAFNDGSSCRMSLEADLELMDDDFENLTSESVSKLHAKVRIGDLTIQSLAGLADLLGQEDPDASTINSLLDLDVLFKDLKIADLEYNEEEENFVIFYKDQSSESAANYVDGFMEDMEALIEEFTGE